MLVRWVELMYYLFLYGVMEVIEMGFKNVLVGLLKKIMNYIVVYFLG